MVRAQDVIGDDYWDQFALQEEDIEFVYNYLLERETPLTTQELALALVHERIQREIAVAESKRTAGGDLYQPKETYQIDQNLIFPALNWRHGRVVGERPGKNPVSGDFQVIQVAFEDGSRGEFATGVVEHVLNAPLAVAEDESILDVEAVLDNYSDDIEAVIENDLRNHADFVRIAGRWFPRALLMDVNIGHLNLAEAVLEMANGGPLPTSALAEQLELNQVDNSRLVEFSLDLALQEDARFDEVGPAGRVLWFLNRLEPPQVLEPPVYLRYAGMDYDRKILSPEMRELERRLDDELSPLAPKGPELDEVDLPLIFAHWRAGTLPLSSRVRHLFPTAYEAPRIQFTLVDGDTGENFSAWVVREKRYIYGLQEWYAKRNLIPGSIIRIQRGEQPGEVVVNTESRRSTREWIRTVLVGSDGGVVFAMLKQIVHSSYDERMACVIPDPEALDVIWNRTPREQQPFERVVINMVRELAKLNPQSHVHATELYAAVNVVRRCPPGPLLALLATKPFFTHVGDLHFRYDDSD